MAKPPAGSPGSAHVCGPVVILAQHALLGQGLAHWIYSRAGVDSTVANASSQEAVAKALATRPRLVIYERTSVVDSMVLAQAAPGAVMLDITHTVGVGTPEAGCVAGMDMIINLVGVVCSVGTDPRHRTDERVCT